MKKILFLGPPFDYYKGGIEYQYKILESHLEHKYLIYYLFQHPEYLPERKYIVYRYRLRKTYKEHLYTDAMTIYKLIRCLCPDIIYMQGLNYITAVGVFYSKRNNVKMVFHIASSRDIVISNEHKGIKKIFDLLKNLIAKYVIKNVKHIICQANYQNTVLLNNFNRKSDIVIPNFHPLPSDEIQKQLPIKVVWVANLKKLKQPELFVQLAEKFSRKENAEFIMIGRPWSNREWQKYIQRKTELLQNFRYLGELPIENVNSILNQSHIFVNTSKYEGFPNTYIQAWMRGLPVVTLNCDPDDIIKNKRIGFHSKTFNQLIEDVSVLVNNNGLRKQMSENAQKFAQSTFSTKNINHLIHIFDTL